jgi:hypothetical protein
MPWRWLYPLNMESSMMHARWMLLASTILFAGCAPAVADVRTGAPHPAKAASCPLEFASVSAGDMAPGAKFGSGGKYEMIGMVSIGAKEGTDAMSEEIRKLVRPRACAMGGEVVSLLATGAAQYRGQFSAQQNISFTVWGPISAHQGPQRF